MKAAKEIFDERIFMKAIFLAGMLFGAAQPVLADDVSELLNNGVALKQMSDEFLGRWTVGKSCDAGEKATVYYNRVEGDAGVCRFGDMLRHPNKPVVLVSVKCTLKGGETEASEAWMFNSRLNRFLRMTLKPLTETYYWRCPQ